MDKYQRTIYEKVKEEYRAKIFQKVTEEGVSKTAFLILEGLTKLRMLCDSPSLVNNSSGELYKAESIKLEELTREIEENISNHKILVFSQFLGMLDLVRKRLEKDNVKYVYLDGSTPAAERQNIVNQFQEDQTIQVFLMSLKAGGVGLTLTAADYVYIVDPWWNPAVEDQAIDRTHRIGQNKAIFAYKMICKDSIEEKIIQLQEKKKSIVKELISEDAGFVKKLTQEDLEFLFE
jgi:non-specific serine/threonine protein kinase